MRFTGLRRTGLPIAEENDRAGRLFPLHVERSRLHLWRPGEPIAGGRRLLIGVATWSLHDLSLLDILDDAMARVGAVVDRIDVFDLDRLEQGDFEDYIPDLGRVVGTPLAGYWEDRIVGEKGFGWRAMAIILDLFDFTLKWNGPGSRFDVRWGS